MASGQAALIARAPAAARYVEIVAVLARRTLAARYRGSSLGVWWSLSSPLFMTAAYTLVFGAAFSRYYGDSITAYALAAFIGLSVLNFFGGATSRALPVIVANRPLLNKIALPLSAFPAASIAADSFQLAVGIAPLLALLVLLHTHSLLSVAALAVPLVALVLAAAGFALGASALYVAYRDLPHIYEMFVFVLSITSPIFYPISVVPSRIQPYLAINPLTGIVEAARALALGHVDDPFVLVSPLVVGGLALMAGIAVFSLSCNRLRDEL